MNPGRARRRFSDRGIIVLTFALSVVFLVLILGLAIDGGMLYMTRVKLQSAGDAAALAAARSLNLSLTQALQTTDAQNAASAFFNANFPTNYMLASGKSITTGLAYGTTTTTLNTVYVTTTASVNAPTFFMRYLGYTTVPISVTGTASRRDINVILLLDISESMNNGASPSACATMIADAKSFVSQFSNNRDTIGLVTFNDGTNSYAATSNFNPTIVNDINAQSCTGDTNTPAGLHVAYEQLVTLNNPSKLNVIVLFTDGQAEALAATWPIKSASDSRYGDTQGSYGSSSTLYTMPASGCSSAITGTFAENSNDTNGPDQTGITSGPWQYLATGAGQGWNTAPTIPSGCYGASVAGQNLNGGGGGWNNMEEGRRDVAYIPATDIYGNSTTGFRTDYNFNTTSVSVGQDEFPAGYTYAGQLRPDKPITFFNAAANAADNQATTARSDTTLNPMILTIGLGGNAGNFPVDSELLQRIANVPSGTTPPGFASYPVRTITNGNYSTSQAQGLYVYAPTASQLSSAFAQVASFLVELSH